MLKHPRKLYVEKSFHNLTEDGYEKLPGNNHTAWDIDHVPYKVENKAMMSAFSTFSHILLDILSQCNKISTR